MNKIYAIDLDGTLFSPKHPFLLLDRKTVKNIRKIEQNGDYFVAVTGRNYLSTLNLFKKVKTKPYIVGCNGSFIYANGKYLSQQTLDGNLIKKIRAFIESKYPNVILSVMPKDGVLYFDKSTTSKLLRFFYKLYNSFLRKLGNIYKASQDCFDDAVKNNEVYKLMVIFGLSKKAKLVAKEANKEVFAKFGDEVETAWSNQAIEITAKNVSKKNGILTLSKHLGIDKANVVVMGDSGNDIPMFKEFYENSYCMEKSDPSVKKYAKYTVKRFNDIEHLLKQERIWKN